MKNKFYGLILRLGKPITYLSAYWLKFVKNVDTKGKHSDKAFMKIGLLPLLDHYYQPLINPKKHLHKSLRENRDLPAIKFNDEEQIDLLNKFNYNDELLSIPIDKRSDVEYYYNNESFSTGDAEYLYNIIRHFKPKKIIEIGSGLSTLMAKNAVDQNAKENLLDICEQICIEPYEQPWLEKVGINLIRQKVEFLEKGLFKTLQANDILFIDSSHIIRPQGDVLFEYLEILPILNSGVIIHVHDIFSPKDYPDQWVNNHLLWNEQYLLEAFLSFNNDFRIIGALNYLTHNHREKLNEKCPHFSKDNNREAGSFWMIKN
jgi:predicted O-methyltransferase YrrM